MSTPAYLRHLHELTNAQLSIVFNDSAEVSFTDFPDYANVGDSAIALGLLAFLSERVRISSVSSIATCPPIAKLSTDTVVINGGGNLGGLYPVVDDHRYALANKLPPSTRLVQAPQSLHFVTDADRQRFEQVLSARPRTLVSVRDTVSLSKVSDPTKVVLAPDCAHMLGKIEPTPSRPTEKYVVLARTDDERVSDQPVVGATTHDWLVDSFWTGRRARARWISHRLSPRRYPWKNPSAVSWQRIAETRLARGINLLSLGDIVVTDRLHAMILGLQLGKRVIAVDNSNNKLSAYAQTWLADASVPIEFETSLSGAIRRAKQIHFEL